MSAAPARKRKKNIAIEASIPIKSYLKKFVLWMESEDGAEVLDLSGENAIAYTLTMLLTGKSNLNLRTHPNLQKLYNDDIKIRIPKQYLDNGKIYFDFDNIVIFNRFLFRFFHDILLQRIMFNQQVNIDIKSTIYQFVEELDIADDVTMDALIKASYRHRKRKKNSRFRSVNCL